MPELICNTSPIQYLHQLNLLQNLPALADEVIVPRAVIEELAVGRSRGVDLPSLAEIEWMAVQSATSTEGLTFVSDLGAGEKEVLALALERRGAVAVLDDLLARSFAEMRSIPLTGTLGLLLDFKRRDVIGRVRPYLDQLNRLGFRLARQTWEAVLKLANEESKS